MASRTEEMRELLLSAADTITSDMSEEASRKFRAGVNDMFNEWISYLTGLKMTTDVDGELVLVEVGDRITLHGDAWNQMGWRTRDWKKKEFIVKALDRDGDPRFDGPDGEEYLAYGRSTGFRVVSKGE